MQQCERNGFTLVEILVVATIIGFLATLGMVGYQAAGKSGRDAKRKGDLEQIRSALEIYKSENSGVYPAVNSCVPAGLAPGYINTIPSDPNTTYKYCYIPGAAPIKSYTLCVSLEAASGGLIAACGNNCGSGVCNYAVYNP